MGTPTTTPPPADVTTAPAGDRPPRPARLRPYLRDAAVVLGYLAAAVWLLHGLWPDPTVRAMALNPEDQILIEWFLADGTRVLTGEHGLVSDRLNAPDGMNMLANATSLTLSLLLSPVTLTLGAPVSFAVLTTGNLAATAAAWYLLFSRTLRVHPATAAAAGALCGFSPAMISHSNSHWHMTAQWLVPALVWAFLRLVRAAEAGDRRRLVTSAVWLAGLVVVQLFLGEEVLYLTAVTLLLFTLVYAALRPRWARRVAPGFLAGMALATGLGVVVLAYPLWVQFAGPGSVPNGPFPASVYSADLRSWVAFSPLSLAGSDAAAHLATSAAEYNTFLGTPLLLVAAGCVAWLRRHAVVVAATVTALIMAVLSLGPELVIDGRRTGVVIPYWPLAGAPVVDGALPQRYAVAVVPLLAIVLVLALERARRLPDRRRLLAPVAVGAALLPLVPTPLPTEHRPPVPVFVSDGHWRECVRPGGVLVPVPLPTPKKPEPMRWAAAANAAFALPEGFFIGPYGRDGRASMGVFPRPTSQLLAAVAAGEPAPPVGDVERAQARADLAYWGAECVVLGPGQPNEAELRTVLEQLLGPPQRIADAYVWPVATGGTPVSG